jgi:hypothetical protein
MSIFPSKQRTSQKNLPDSWSTLGVDNNKTGMGVDNNKTGNSLDFYDSGNAPLLPVSSENITTGFKSAEALHAYLTYDQDTIDLDTVKNLYKTMLNTSTLTAKQEKSISDVFNRTAGTNKIIDKSEMLTILDALNGSEKVTFDPNAKPTDRKIDRDGSVQTPPPLLPVSSENITTGFKSAEALHAYLTYDQDTIDLDTVKNLYKTMLNTSTLTAKQEKSISDVFNRTAGTNKIIDKSEMLTILDALNGSEKVTFDPNAKPTDRKIDRDGVLKNDGGDSRISPVSKTEWEKEVSKKSEYTQQEVKQVLKNLFPIFKDSDKEELLSEVVTTLFTGYKEWKPTVYDGSITADSLKNALVMVAQNETTGHNGNKKDVLSYAEVSHIENWQNLPKGFALDGTFVVGSEYSFDDSNLPEWTTITETINGKLTDVEGPGNTSEEKTFNIDGYAKIPIEGANGKTIRVPEEYQSVMDSLLKSPAFKKSVLNSLKTTNEDTLYIINTDLPGLRMGQTENISTSDAMVSRATQAIMKIDFDFIKTVALNYTDTNQNYDPFTQKQKLIEQVTAQTIIHELGHIEGCLGSDEQCTHGATMVHHGPDHSKYIGGIFNEWLEKTKQKPLFDVEAEDYSNDTYFDRRSQLQKTVTNNGAKLGNIFYDIQEALFVPNPDNPHIGDLINSIPEDMVLLRTDINPQTGETNTTSVSARKYIIGLLLYETLDVSGLGGTDEDSGEISTYSADTTDSIKNKFNKDSGLEKELLKYYKYLSNNSNDPENQEQLLLFKEVAIEMALDDDFRNNSNRQSSTSSSNNVKNPAIKNSLLMQQILSI